MSKKQWGHGYYKGIEEAKKNKSVLVDLFVLSFDDDNLPEKRMRVIREISDNKYAVLFYSWITGQPTIIRILSADDLKDCFFYTTERDWLEASFTKKRSPYDILMPS